MPQREAARKFKIPETSAMHYHCMMGPESRYIQITTYLVLKRPYLISFSYSVQCSPYLQPLSCWRGFPVRWISRRNWHPSRFSHTFCSSEREHDTFLNIFFSFNITPSYKLYQPTRNKQRCVSKLQSYKILHKAAKDQQNIKAIVQVRWAERRRQNHRF